MKEPIPAVILAGGLSRRMGGGNKAQRLLAGETLLTHVLRRLRPQCGVIAINANGEVFAYFNDRVEPENLGQITLANFVNEKGLEAIGSNLFLESTASGAPQVAAPGEEGLGTIRAGFLEESSVDPVREIAELIKAQRGYELNSKVITAADQMLGTTVQVR